MSVRIGCGLSESADAREGAIEAALTAARGLDGEHADIAVVFATGAHLAAPEATLEGVNEGLAPTRLVGCGAGGVLGAGREVESGTAVAVWAAALGGEGRATPFHAMTAGDDVEGLPDVTGASAVILLPDPFSFSPDAALDLLNASAPGLPVLGGIASARTADGGGALFLDDEVVEAGAVGVSFEGVEVVPCVSQGAAPIGPELTITAAEGNIVQELAGRPALAALRDVVDNLGERDRALIGEGLLLGIVVDVNKPDYEQGDFLVRGVLGADPETGAIAVGAAVVAGQVVRVHARDAQSADRDLHAALSLRRAALGGRTPAGALVFSCNGRGRGMFGKPDHDALAVGSELAGAPIAGFFAAGEIGPVGGETFVHGFTATVAVFPP